MNRRMMLTAGGGAGAVVPPDPVDPEPSAELGQWTVATSDPETADLPYAIPTTSPRNVTGYIALPVAGGSGQTVHPGVLDFHPNTWNGHRYWMGVTAYPFTSEPDENPHIFASDNGYDWTLPAGVSAPLVPYAGGTVYNSDTELVYNSADQSVTLFYRLFNESASPVREEMWSTRSTDGANWSAPVLAYAATGTDTFPGILSPAIVKIPDGGWRMFAAAGYSGGTLHYWNAASLTGPWTHAGVATMTGSGNNIWHLHVVRYGTRLYMAADGVGDQGIYPAISDDWGLTWQCGPDFITGQASPAWDRRPYRATLALHPELDKFRIWYSARGAVSDNEWRTGYTHAPKTLWDSLA